MKIIFENTDKSIGIIHPTQEILQIVTIEEIAQKDVPSGLSYWIVEDSIIPTDRTFRNAWEIGSSFGEPHGFGRESNEFDAELLAKWKKVYYDNY